MSEERVRKPTTNYDIYNTEQTVQKQKQIYKKINIILNHQLLSLYQNSKNIVCRCDKVGNVRFRGNQWNKLGAKAICQHIKQWHIQKGLYIQSCNQPNILQQIANIQFLFLTNLNLTGNNIETIQPIYLLTIPNLQRLTLSQNKITSIKSLRKCAFPKLLFCTFGGNRVLDLSLLSECNFPLLHQFNQEGYKDNSWCNIFTWIAKLETDSLEQLCKKVDKLGVSSNNRIWQFKSQRSLQRRHLKRKQITFYVSIGNYFR